MIFAILINEVVPNVYPCSMGMTLSGDDSGVYTTAHVGSYSAYSTLYLTGSLCPLTSGYYYLYAKGRQSVEITFDGSTDGNGESGKCTADTTDGTVKKYCNAHQCYIFQMRYNTGCGIYNRWAYINVKNPGEDYQRLNSSDTIQCQWSNCLLDYYGSDCSNQCDIDCNSNGFCSNGTTGTGKCDCTSYSSNPFCEDTSSYHFTSTLRGITEKIYETEYLDNVMTTSLVSSFPITGLNLCYQAVILSGYVYLPQNGYYDFETLSSAQAKLMFISTYYGSIPDANLCDLSGANYTTTVGKQYYTKGNYQYQIQTRSGCPMKDTSISLLWKFYRYYDNSASTPWEVIPSRYLANTNPSS